MKNKENKNNNFNRISKNKFTQSRAKIKFSNNNNNNQMNNNNKKNNCNNKGWSKIRKSNSRFL